MIRPPLIFPAGRATSAKEQRIQQYLIRMVREAHADTKLSGASIVLLGMQLWAAEMIEMDREAAGEYLRCLSEWAGPNMTEERFEAIEDRRQAAAMKIFNAVTLSHAKPEGRA